MHTATATNFCGLRGTRVNPREVATVFEPTCSGLITRHSYKGHLPIFVRKANRSEGATISRARLNLPVTATQPPSRRKVKAEAPSRIVKLTLGGAVETLYRLGSEPLHFSVPAKASHRLSKKSAARCFQIT